MKPGIAVAVAMDIEPGQILLDLVLDTLSGRSPLYHLEGTFEAYDQTVLFGQERPAGYFNDDNVGRILDHLFDVGTQKIFSALSVSALQRFELSPHPVPFDTTSVTVYGDYRAIVVHSSAHDKRRQKRLERELEASLKQIKALAKACEKRVFSCQADAETVAAEAMAEDTAYHRLEIRVVEQPRYAQGRPRKNSPRIPLAIAYGLQAKVIEKQEAIERRRKMAGCFVLLTNVSGETEPGYSAEQILRTYKDQ